MFIKQLEKRASAVEREQAVFSVEVKDPEAPVDFYITGERLNKADPRCEYTDLGGGKHQLVIAKVGQLEWLCFSLCEVELGVSSFT